MTDKEQFVCLNCHFVGELNKQLRCSKCNSEQVLSKILLENVQTSLAEKARDVREELLRSTLQPLKWYHFIYGPFDIFVSNYAVEREMGEDTLDKAKEFAVSQWGWRLRQSTLPQLTLDEVVEGTQPWLREQDTEGRCIVAPLHRSEEAPLQDTQNKGDMA